MVSGVGFQSNNLSIEEKQRPDIPANLEAKPSYIQNNDLIKPADVELGKHDFDFTKNTAILKLKARPTLPMPQSETPYYVENELEQTVNDVAASYQEKVDELAEDEDTKALLDEICMWKFGKKFDELSEEEKAQIEDVIDEYFDEHWDYKEDDVDGLNVDPNNLEGDCEDKAVLEAAVLKAAGVEDVHLVFTVNEDGVIDHTEVAVGDKILGNVSSEEVVLKTGYDENGNVVVLDEEGNINTSSYAINTQNKDENVDVEQQAINAAEEILDEAEACADQLGNGNWVDEYNGYKYIDPEFFVKYEELMSYMNVLQVLGTIIDAIHGLKEFILKTRFTKETSSGGDASASEVLSIARESGMLIGQSQFMELTENVYTHNQTSLQQRLEWAREAANAEGYNAWSVICDLASSGGAKASERNCDYLYAKKANAIVSDYEDFQKNIVTPKYQEVLCNSELYNDGMTGLGDVFAMLTQDFLQVDIGAGKVDVDRDLMMATQLKVSSLENGRRLFTMYQAALKEIKIMVVENTTGAKFSGGVREALNGLVDGLERFENMCFSALGQQIQTNIYWHNMREDSYVSMKQAKYLRNSAYAVGWVPILGGLLRGVGDWIAMEAFDNKFSFSTSPSKLSQEQVACILSQIYGSNMEQVRDGVTNYEDVLKKLEDLEQKEWGIVAQLSPKHVTYTGSDGYKNFKEAEVNALREQLVKIQNAARLLIMYIEGTNRLAQIVLKIQWQVGTVDTAKDAKSSLTIGLQGRLLAFDLKQAGIKNNIESFNTKLKHKEMLKKARAAGIGSLIGAGIAVILIVAGAFTGIGLLGALALVAAMGQLGAAIGNLIYNLSNPVDDSINEATDFYGSADKNEDEMDKKYNNAIDQLNENSHILADDSAATLASGDMWALDTAAFMAVRNQLTAIYITEQLLNMYVKGHQDISNAVVAGTTGINTSSDFWGVKKASQARFNTKIKAYDLKESMVKDIISRHNLATMQESEINWAIIQAAISVVSIALSVAGGATGEFAKQGLQACEWGAFAASTAGMVVSGVKNGLDAYSGYGELDEFERIQQMIDNLAENSFYSEGADLLRGAFQGIHEDNIMTDVGRGHMVANSSNYYTALRQIQQLYNKLVIMYRVQDAIARIKAKIAKAPAPYGVSETFEAAKSNYEKQLSLLQERVETYVERYNAKVEAEKQFIIGVVMIAVTVLLKVAEHKGWMKSLKKSLNEALGTKDTKYATQLLDNDSKSRAVLSELLTGSKDAWDGTVGVSDLVNILIDLVINPYTIRLIVSKIYDKAKESDKKADKANTSDIDAKSGKRLDQLENETYLNQMRLASMQEKFAKLGIELQNSLELFNFINSCIETTIKTTMDDSWNKVTNIHRRGKEAGVKDDGTYTMPEDMSYVLEKGVIQPHLEKIDFKKPEVALAKAAKAIKELKDSKDKAYSVDEKRVMAYAAAAVIVEQTANDPAKVKEAVTSLEKFVITQSKDPNRDPMAMNIALTALSMLSAKNTIYAPKAQNAITGVWKNVEKIETAQDITHLSERFYPKEVANGRAAAIVTRAKPKALEQILTLDKKQPVDQALKPKPEEISTAAAVVASEYIALNPQVRQKAEENLKFVVEETRNESLKTYAKTILDRVQSKQTGDRQVNSKAEKIAISIFKQSLSVKDAVKNEKEVEPRLQALKTEMLELAKLLKIQGVNIDYKAIEQTIQKAKTPAEVAEILAGFSKEIKEHKGLKTNKLVIKMIDDSVDILEQVAQKQKTDQVVQAFADGKEELIVHLTHTKPGLVEKAKRQLKKKKVDLAADSDVVEREGQGGSSFVESVMKDQNNPDQRQADVWKRAAEKTEEVAKQESELV